MKTCVVCKKNARKFSHRTYNGVICKNCEKYLPINVSLKECDSDYLIELIARKKEKAKDFSCTASYGALYIDSVHSMLCISMKGNKDTPSSLGDVFAIKEIKEMGLYCTDIKNVGGRVPKLICNVKFRIVTDDVKAEYTISRSEPCSFTKAKNGDIHWKEPEKLSMFRNMINQMIENITFGFKAKLDAMHRFKDAGSSKQWAKGILFLPDKDVSEAEIKSHYKSLMRMFHPDINPRASEEYAQLLNEAYKILTSK